MDQHGSAGDSPSLVRKLGVKPGRVVVLVSAPPDWAIEDLPDDVDVQRWPAWPEGVRDLTCRPDLVVSFWRQQVALRHDAELLTRVVPPDGAVWTAWPRRAAGHRSDITDNVLREVLLPTGLVDVKVAALGADWSGLKFVWRKEARARLRA